MKKKKTTADIIDQPMGAKLEIRLPQKLKDDLTKESKELGFNKLSRYILTILINRT